jgi:hypothetical protein
VRLTEPRPWRQAEAFAGPAADVIAAGRGRELPQPADLLRAIHQLCHPRGRRLLLFESLDTMVRAWGANGARSFFARCCPLLLEVGAIAYRSMTARETPAAVRDTVEAVTQCVLRVDERSVRVANAEAREGVRGWVLHSREEGGRPVLAPAELVGHGEVLVADSERVGGWRDLGQAEAVLFWIVTPGAPSSRPRGLLVS